MDIWTYMYILKPFSRLQHAAAVKLSDSMNINIANDSSRRAVQAMQGCETAIRHACRIALLI